VKRLLPVAVLLTLPGLAAAAAAPRLLHDAPLHASGLRLLVADSRPFVLDVDSGRTTPVRGLGSTQNAVVSVVPVGRDAALWVDRREGYLGAGVYSVRHGAAVARRIGTAWEVAPSADGRAVWLKSYRGARRCTLAEVRLDGTVRTPARPLPCSARLVGSGTRPLLGRGGSLVDPATGRVLLRAANVLAVTGRYAVGESGGRLWVADFATGRRRALRWPSTLAYADAPAVAPGGRLIALGFADPAYGGGATQVADAWLLDPASGRLTRVPGLPAAVALKFTSMSWTADGRLVWLAESGGRDVVAVWRPGRRRLSVRPVRIPRRTGGSDTFAAWEAPQ